VLSLADMFSLLEKILSSLVGGFTSLVSYLNVAVASLVTTFQVVVRSFVLVHGWLVQFSGFLRAIAAPALLFVMGAFVYMLDFVGHAKNVLGLVTQLLSGMATGGIENSTVIGGIYTVSQIANTFFPCEEIVDMATFLAAVAAVSVTIRIFKSWVPTVA